MGDFANPQILGQGIRDIPQNVQEMQANPITRNLPFGLGPALGVLSSLPTAEPFLQGAGVPELGGINTPLGRLTGRGALGAVADPLNLIPIGTAGRGVGGVGRALLGEAGEAVSEGVARASDRAVGRFSPQTAVRNKLAPIAAEDIAGERNARFVLGGGEVIGGPEGVLHAELAEQAGTNLDRLLQSGAVRIYNEGGGRIAVQATKKLTGEQAQFPDFPTVPWHSGRALLARRMDLPGHPGPPNTG